jgi:response regulator RpfG family c-di-GMP phosphodiesterase
MSQRIKTSARGLVLPRSSSPENGHLRKKEKSFSPKLTDYFIQGVRKEKSFSPKLTEYFIQGVRNIESNTGESTR